MLTLFNKICSFLMFIGGLGVIALMLNIVADVVAKLVWNAPIQGTVEMSSYYYMVALVMLPMAYVEMQDQQISVDLLFNHFPIWLQKVALTFSCLAAAAILAVIAWRTGLDAMRALRVGEVVMGGRRSHSVAIAHGSTARLWTSQLRRLAACSIGAARHAYYLV